MTVLDALGFARRAGRLAVGATATWKSAARGGAKAILIAKDASPRIRRHAERFAAERAIPLFEWGTKDSLGAALGRSEVGVVAVCDEGLARSLTEILQSGG